LQYEDTHQHAVQPSLVISDNVVVFHGSNTWSWLLQYILENDTQDVNLNSGTTEPSQKQIGVSADTVPNGTWISIIHKDVPCPVEHVMIIVSCTSFDKRVAVAHPAVATLFLQSVQADKVILWLPETQPTPQLKKLEECYGLEIRSCEDVGPATKLIHALREFPDATIVTADDDKYYRYDWLKELLDKHAEYPDKIVCHAAGGIDVRLRQYFDWHETKPASAIPCPCGFAGVLYPPHTLYQDVCNTDLLKRLTYYQDDLWFWAQARLAGTDSIQVNHFDWSDIYPTFSGNKAGGVCLWERNVFQGGNQSYLQAILDYYPQLS